MDSHKKKTEQMNATNALNAVWKSYPDVLMKFISLPKLEIMLGNTKFQFTQK